MKSVNRQQSIRNIVIFALLVNGLAWLGPLLGGTPTAPGPGVLVWATAPLVAALVMRFVVRDPVSLGMRPAIRGNGRWYGLSLLYYPLAIGLVLAAGTGLGATVLGDFSAGAFVTALIPLAVSYLLFAIFEEVGWRGYLAPKVAGIDEGLLGHAIVGLIWASWHFPYMRELWGHTSAGLEILLPLFLLGTVVSTVVYGEIRKRTGSVWPAVLMHWVGNSLANTLLVGGFVTLVPGREWLGSFGVEGVLMIGLAGVVGFVLYTLTPAVPPPPSAAPAEPARSPASATSTDVATRAYG